ncbi:glycosyltransferase [Gimesia panareensis]|uniref:glycosyltransferase n=1 Tax=Gimesia panareensis TaxID=2527978 RepID=UPI00118BBEC1|nr:glycosyltransferase [Gimesia panareensis]QDU50771.1 Putative glycosyltransferase EpsF [Gimesia panareensis]
MSTIELTEVSENETPETKPARKLRVCHLSLTLCTGGLERLLVDFARFNNSDQFELEFVALGETGAPAEDIQKLGCPVIQFPLTAPGKLGRIRQLQEFFKEKNYDLLHTHNAYPHFYGTLAGRLAGIPAIVQTRHGRRFGNTFNERLQFALASRLADRVIPVSDDTGNRCREVGWLSQNKVTRIWNGIDVDRFAFSGPAAQMRAITVSRLSPEKDLTTLLKAVRLVKETIPEFELMIVGDGPERKKLEQITAALHLESRVRFLGERNDVPDLLTQAGFYVSSSLTEGISLTLLEAMSVGLPIVATSVGGNPEIVQQPDTGLLVPSANAALLSDAICEMCSQPDKWLGMGQAARERVEQHFNVRSMIKDYENLYHQILNLQIK